MRFTETALAGAFIIDIEPRADERGFFSRTACADEFATAGLNGSFVQQSISWNPRRGTLRGMHFQVSPGEEDKLVRATRGAIFDVIVDLRPGSPTLGQWISVELTADNHRQIYVPKGFAHGFQTLVDDSEVFYEMTVRYQPGAARGIRWDDPELSVPWPIAFDPADRSILSETDAVHPLMADRR